MQDFLKQLHYKELAFEMFRMICERLDALRIRMELSEAAGTIWCQATPGNATCGELSCQMHFGDESKHCRPQLEYVSATIRIQLTYFTRRKRWSLQVSCGGRNRQKRLRAFPKRMRTPTEISLPSDAQAYQLIREIGLMYLRSTGKQVAPRKQQRK